MISLPAESGKASRRRFLTLLGGTAALVGLSAACQTAPSAPAGSATAPTGASPQPLASVASQPSPATAPSPSEGAEPSGAPHAAPSAGVPRASPSVLSNAQPVTINVGHSVPSINDLGLYVAQMRGFLDEYGIGLNQTVLQTSTDVINALVSGSVDTAVNSPPTLIVAYAKGATDLALIGGLEEKVSYSLVTSQSATSYADLKGQTIGISSFGDGLTVLTRMLLAQGGLADTDYSFVAIGASPARAAALVSGGVAGVVVSQPYDFQLERQGYNKLGDTTQVAPSYSFSGLASRRTWIDQNQDVATRFLAGLLRAQQFLADPANRDAVVQQMETVVQTSPEDAAATYDLVVTQLQAYPADLTPSTAGLEAVINVSIQLGDITPPGPSISDLLDLGPLHAAQQLVASGS